MRFTKALGAAGALIVAALVGGTLIGSTLATDETGETDAPTRASTYCDTFLDALAGELGVTREELTTAGRAAATAAVDAAVEAGDLSEERAERLRERIAASEGEECGLFGHARAFGRGFGAGLERGLARGFLGGDVLEAAADALDIPSEELIGELRDAGSLRALAEEQGVSYDELAATIVAAVTADLDAAVEEGLDRERADAAVERLTAWLDAGGELPGRPGFGPGHGHHFGPWGDRDRSEDGSDDVDAEGSGA